SSNPKGVQPQPNSRAIEGRSEVEFDVLGSQFVWNLTIRLLSTSLLSGLGTSEVDSHLHRGL
ncbi:MAG TPA: hypothetical protein VF899_06675, partial [Pyrinomonadaceae bacterium]